jgi:hypothetical protein
VGIEVVNGIEVGFIFKFAALLSMMGEADLLFASVFSDAGSALVMFSV